MAQDSEYIEACNYDFVIKSNQIVVIYQECIELLMAWFIFVKYNVNFLFLILPYRINISQGI